MAEQVVKMEIKVDLQCRRCYKKIQKILCDIPQVKDRTFDEKKNAVTITVVSCSPENVRQKILCKGRCFVQGVEILPKKKPTVDKDKDKPKVPTCPSVYVMGCVCPPCLDQGCGGFCPCNCHRGWPPPICDDGCGRLAHKCKCGKPPLCRDGCGRSAHECKCWRPSYSRCCDRCNDEKSSSSWTPRSCDCGRPPVCTNAGYQCESSCSLM